ncbi:MAG TPA: hypothetical protein VEA99_03215 [Gemmatimonadaceae bacterium]|nr:hypothetical protein [Gemmatimonadaceae bacterium]
MRRVALVALLFTSACAQLFARGPSPAELTQVEWERTLVQARVYADSARHVDADRLLATFAAQYAGTPQANETLYWRGVYRLDPANRTHRVADALEMLNAYLATRPDSANPRYQWEAAVLRRTALEIDRLNRAVVAANSATEAASRSAAPAATARPSADGSKDEEIARLRRELDSARDELNRIKRRLERRP